MTDQPEDPIPQVDHNPVLAEAWIRFTEYDLAAGDAQTAFFRLRIWILALGVLAPTLALVYETFQPAEVTTLFAILRVIVIILPISISVLLAGAVKFDAGTRWILLRNSAEAIKKEIFRYRAQATIYSPKCQKDTGESRDAKLARKVKNITTRLMKTQVNLTSVTLPKDADVPSKYFFVSGDDCYSDLSPELYLKYRLDDQATFYQKRSRTLEQTLQRYQWLIYFFGGVGTFLATVGLEIWIAVSTGLVGALTTFLELKRTEQTLISYNQTATDLQGVRVWWLALNAEEREKVENIDKLVEYTETAIQNEHFGWVQEMRETLDELYGTSDEQVPSLVSPDDID